MKKIIGITFRYWNSSNQTEFMGVRSTYVEAVEKMGGTPIIIPNTKNIEDILSICDGILSIGGDDINPAFYKQDNYLNLSKDVDNRQDEFDKNIIEYCFNHNVPLLGICRGMQSIAAFLGGELYQDMAYEHINHPLTAEHEHYVVKINNTGIAQLLPDKFKVNSFHHQVVKYVPNDFNILFKNGDAIEVIEHIEKPIIGVQWHPERYNSNESDIIFSYFWNKVNNGKNN